ncbi:hypothetical protein B0H14DRAFT_3496550 [Mycena olivaceomarginata]|nr:hypothetical protein B0H14DRAFT_3496550 [Mycena olivaceomarginata]
MPKRANRQAADPSTRLVCLVLQRCLNNLRGYRLRYSSARIHNRVTTNTARPQAQGSPNVKAMAPPSAGRCRQSEVMRALGMSEWTTVRQRPLWVATTWMQATRERAHNIPRHDTEGGRQGTRELVRLARLLSPMARSLSPQASGSGGSRVSPIPVSSSSPPSPEVQIIHTRRAPSIEPYPIPYPTQRPAVEEEPQPNRHSIIRYGGRMQQDPPINSENLWLTQARPPTQVPIHSHHICGICWEVPTHLVFLDACHTTAVDAAAAPPPSTLISWTTQMLYASLKTNTAQSKHPLRADFSYDLGDTSLLPEEEAVDSDGISVRVRVKWYQNSDLPFQTWVGHRDEYLDEMLRLEGRGDIDTYTTCGSCGAANPQYRCKLQSCYGPGMFCKSCIVKQHEVLPTHWVQEWNASFFERVGLCNLGLVVQLGHTPGSSFPSMRRGKFKFMLIDVNGIHNIAIQFCQCDSRVEHRQQLMQLFQNMNSLRKISSYHFLCSLELLTNTDSLNPPPNRHCTFMYIVRQHWMMEMMKRTGRGHSDDSVAGTVQGELALPCRACPQLGKNLPDGWDRIDWSKEPEDHSYKFFLSTAQDCNFRLINRDVLTEVRDPIIDNGLGYFCNRVGYKAHLRAHVNKEEISTCSGFQAMFLANAKHVKGLQTTGVGGVTCARHNMWLANGLGDLQHGERYSNMDFLFFSAVLNTIVLYIILSYDITCQYSKNFWTRMKDLPEAMHLDPKKTTVWYKVLNFHILGHKWPCHSPFSFHWMWGAGMTDREVVEQNWEFLNGAAGSTKMMGLGGRHACRRMARDLKEARKHRKVFEAFTELLEGERPDLVTNWKGWVKDWESVQHTDGTGSPFEMTKQVHAMKDIRLRLAREELMRTGAGVEIECQHTSTTFITLGMEIEQSQRILTIDLKALANPSPLQELDFLKWKTALLKQINRFRKLQRTYMPDVARFLTPAQRELWEDKKRSPEAIKLFILSELTSSSRGAVCETELVGIEEEMCVGEIDDTLEDLRDALRCHESPGFYFFARRVLATRDSHDATT